jgi:hypothetical protein
MLHYPGMSYLMLYIQDIWQCITVRHNPAPNCEDAFKGKTSHFVGVIILGCRSWPLPTSASSSAASSTSLTPSRT